MQPHVSCLRPSHLYLPPVHNSPLALFICIEVGAAGQVYLIQTSIWSGKSRRAGKLAISPKIKTKQTTTTKKTVHQVSQTSAFEIRSTISALKLLSCNITKVETRSSQREGGRRGGDGEIGDLSCQSKKYKTKPNQKPSSHTF